MTPLDKAGSLHEHLPQSLRRLRPKKESNPSPTLLPHRIHETTATPGASLRCSKGTYADAPRWRGDEPSAAARPEPFLYAPDGAALCRGVSAGAACSHHIYCVFLDTPSSTTPSRVRDEGEALLFFYETNKSIRGQDIWLAQATVSWSADPRTAQRKLVVCELASRARVQCMPECAMVRGCEQWGTSTLGGVFVENLSCVKECCSTRWTTDLPSNGKRPFISCVFFASPLPSRRVIATTSLRNVHQEISGVRMRVHGFVCGF